MKVYQTNEIKNIALLGSSGSGKTTLVEAMLFESGVIKRRGSVAAKNTVSDYFPVEQEYGYSVFSTVLHVEWNNKKLNIIDCPGSDDFVGSTVTALNVTDTASSSGVRIRSRSKASSTALCTASIARAKIRGTFFCFNRATTRIDAPKFSPIATITISTLFNGNLVSSSTAVLL